ncbi:cytochrome c oxidase assembly protein [Sphaerisporangium rufum]|uniref:Cytochrome c oxidase assembly protein n=1 Tax=Sphaerisporangium rufum TaxID=1381558 RepID=A0A919RBL2_9ACTN|nr:cytochrome d ubiquinol oxidase subunit II [Sphaerisporangium rufum]GII80960.1 cytochrome c oxidase assembly protein [Sphaerisporangium rufum]
MDVVWLTVLILMLGGWALLDGFVIGLGMLLPRLADDAAGRRLVLTGMGPFFLTNEVWLIAAAGVMTGAFPEFESRLLSGCRPIVIIMLAGWIAKDAATWFRSRRDSDRWRTTWERVLAVACACFAFAFGLLLGNITQGLPGAAAGSGFFDLFNPFTLLCGVATVLLFALHGAAFVAVRVPQAPGDQARRIAAALVRPALGAVALAVVAGAFSGDVRGAVSWLPALAFLVAGLAAVVGAGRAVTARPGRAFALTAAGAVAPVLAALAGAAPAVLHGAADAASLSLFAGMALPVLPVMLLAQAWLWWTFRHPVGPRSPVFF